jgi:hypothetical protein
VLLRDVSGPSASPERANAVQQYLTVVLYTQRFNTFRVDVRLTEGLTDGLENPSAADTRHAVPQAEHNFNLVVKQFQAGQFRSPPHVLNMMMAVFDLACRMHTNVRRTTLYARVC